MIRRKIDRDRDLTLNECVGKVCRREIEESIRVYYESEPTMNIVWDFSGADLSAIGASEIEDLAQKTKVMAHSREEGKTAIIAPTDISFGLSRMYQVFADMAEQIASIGVFRSAPEAEEWIRSE